MTILLKGVWYGVKERKKLEVTFNIVGHNL
jgi:hypothetical protein